MATGQIAAAFTEDLRMLPAAEVAAVGSRSLDRARAFAARHGIPRAYGDWRELAADPGVDVVYVATPHAAHHGVSAVMLEAGKAVLCEKPLALNTGQASDLVGRARRRGVFLMEAMWTRCLPAIRAMTAVIASGDIGEPRLVVADFGFTGPDDPRHRLRDPSQGGGALLDIGVYLASLAHLVLGPPAGVIAAATLTPEGVDAATTMMLTYQSGALASLACSIVAQTPTVAAICGTAGQIVLGRRFYAPAGFQLWHGDRVTRQVRAPYRGHGLAHEAEEVMRCLAEGRTESPLVPLTASVSVLGTLDQARAQAGGGV